MKQACQGCRLVHLVLSQRNYPKEIIPRELEADHRFILSRPTQCQWWHSKKTLQFVVPFSWWCGSPSSTVGKRCKNGKTGHFIKTHSGSCQSILQISSCLALTQTNATVTFSRFLRNCVPFALAKCECPKPGRVFLSRMISLALTLKGLNGWGIYGLMGGAFVT